MRRSLMFRNLSLTLCFAIFFSLWSSYTVFAASIGAVLSNRTELTELNLNDAVIRVTISGDTFLSTINASNYDLVNEPSGTTIKSITWINSTTVDIALSFSGQDFDGSIGNFYIKLFKEALTGKSGDLNSNIFTIMAAIERITYTTTPSPLTETNLNGNKVLITLENDTLKSAIDTSHFSIHNPAGMGAITIAAVNTLSNTQVELTLSYNGQDFDINKTDFRIKLLKSALNRTNTDLETSNITINYVQEGVSVATINPSPLMETDLNGTVITLNLSGDIFITNISQLNFQLVNPVAGLSISRVDRISDTKVNVTLAFNGADFDIDKTNFAIKLLKTGLTRTVTDLQTSNMIIYAVVEGSPSIRLTTNPIQLYELSLNGCYVTLTLREDDFKTIMIPSYFQLNNAPANTMIYRATRIDDHKVYLELSFDGTDFDTDITNFSITTLPVALVGGKAITSNDIAIIANKEIEGQGDYIVTGESYPTDIQMTGYNSRDNKMYINVDLETNKTILTGQTAVYEYFAWIYDNNGNIIGREGSIETPLSVSGTTTAKVKNLEVSLTAPLTSQYRIVVSVIQVSIN